MSLYDLFPDEEANQTDEGLRATPKPPPGAPWYAGMMTEPLRGIASGMAKIVVPLEGDRPLPSMPPIGAPAWAYAAYERQFKPAENLTPEQREQRANQATADAIKEFSPDPRTTGWVGQTLAGLADMGTRATVGAVAGGPVGAAAVVSASSGASTLQNLQAQGVDPATAHKAAAWDAVTSGSALGIPFGVGKQLLTKLVTGASTNVAFGMADRYVNGKILDDAGYTAMAEQYHVLDKQAILTDALMGTFFGGGAYLHDRMASAGKGLPPAVGDVALASAEQLHVENSADGVPKTSEARGNHVHNFEETLAAVMDDREPIGLKDVETVPNPLQDEATRATTTEVEATVREALGEPVEASDMLPEGVYESDVLSEEQKQALRDSNIPFNETTVTIEGETRKMTTVGRPTEAPQQMRDVSLLGRTARMAEAKKAEGDVLATLDPDAQEAIAAAQKHLDENPDMKIVNPNSEEGNVAGGRDFLKEATDDIANGKLDGELAQVMASCSLREG